MFVLVIIACVDINNTGKIVESTSAIDSQVDTATITESLPETDTEATTPVIGTHRFVFGCTDDLDETVLCGMMLDFRFKAKIDIEPDNAELIPLQYDLWWESAVGAPGLYVVEAEVHDDSDVNLEYFRPLWAVFGYMERPGECDQDDTEGNSVAWIPNKGINSWSEAQSLTFHEFLAGGTTACVAHTDNAAVSLNCVQFSTQACDDTWESVIGVGCDFLSHQPVQSLADSHPYFYGQPSVGG